MNDKTKSLSLSQDSASELKVGSEILDPKSMGLSDFVQRYQKLVVNTCYGFLHNASDAEDAAQEVFIKAWQALPEFRGECKVSTWLYRIASRTSLDILKKRKRNNRWEWLLSLVGWRETSVLSSIEKDPLVVVEERERAKLLMKAIDNLPDSQRQAYVLATFEHLKGKEIAEVLGSTSSAVESLLVRARKSLRKQLENYYSKKGLEKEESING